MKVSLIIPIYNVEEVIERAIVSAVTQDYSDLEFVLVDDGVQDRSYEIAREVVERYGVEDRTKFIIHSENRGVSEARNSGLDAASGEYVFFLDNDDELASNDVISYLASFVAEDQKSPDLISGNFYRVIDGEPAETLAFSSRDYTNNADIFKAFSQMIFWHTAWGKLIRRDFLITHNIRFKPGIYHEDDLWFFDIARHANSILVKAKIIYNFWLRNNSITFKLKEQHAADLVTVVQEMYRAAQENRQYHPKLMARSIECYRKITLERMFQFSDRAFLDRELTRLKSVRLSPFATRRFGYLKQNLLLKLPNAVIIPIFRKTLGR